MPLPQLSSSIRPFLVCILLRLVCGQTSTMSFSRTSLKYDAPVGSVSVTPEISVDDLETVVEVHNRLRRKQGAADMEFLKWHSFLATLAEERADLCSWAHGQLSQDPNVRSFLSVGQSMYASRSSVVSVGEVIQQWYEEGIDYDFQTHSCRSGHLCELYAQIVWASSREVGCAIKLCPLLSELNWTNASLVICNYAPSGVWSNEEPFHIGSPCTKCGTGGMWCERGLCNSFCQESGLKCTCDAKCGCGQLDPETCVCSCGFGWVGPDCSEKCANEDESCGNGPSWSLGSCSEEDEIGRFLRRTCPATCQLCQAANSSNPAACSHIDADPIADTRNSCSQQHLIPNILILWTFAAAWMLTVERFNWNGSFLNHPSLPVDGTDTFSSTRNSTGVEFFE